LRRALHEIAGLIPTLSVPAARRYLQAAVGRIEPYLSGVTNQAVAPGDFKRVRLGRSQRHYERILRKSEAGLLHEWLTVVVTDHAASSSATSIRTALQHAERSGELAMRLEDLGLPIAPINWAQAWEAVASVTVDALRTLRSLVRETNTP
jgi:hypothetical protein